jgi:hypothetical protein
VRKRFTVNLNTDVSEEALLADYIVSYDERRRQELLRTLLKVGYATLVQHKSAAKAAADGIDKEAAIHALTMLISGEIFVQRGEGAAHISTGNNGSGAVQESSRAGRGESPSKPSVNKSNAASAVAGNDFKSNIESAPVSIAPGLPHVDVDSIQSDEEDGIDPMQKLMALMPTNS